MESMVEIINVLLEGVMSIFDGTSGVETAASDAVRKLKGILLMLGIALVCGAVIALTVWLISRL